MTTKTEAAHDARKVLQGVKDFYTQPGHVKLTEADTRAHFIDPLIRALGYHDIGDVQHELFLAPAKQYLDYLLFLDGKARIAVEAKALDVGVGDAHGGAQVVQYAVILGVEWSVATNGRQWRLYQTSAKGPLEEKLIVSVDLIGWDTDSQFETVFDQLWLVSKESLASGAGPETWLSAKHLHETLKTTLVDPSSAEIKVLRKRLLDRGITTTAEEVATWFKGHLDSQTAPTQPATSASPLPVASQAAHTPAPVSPPSAAAPPVIEMEPLAAAVASKKRVGDGPLFFLTPVRNEPEATVDQTLHSLLDQGVYVFGNRTAGRGVLRGGDAICFYASGVGVVAHAKITSSASMGTIKFAKNPDRFPWWFAVSDVHYYLDDPVELDLPLRTQLDAFKGKNPGGNWSWFVQGTGYVSARDFELLTRR